MTINERIKYFRKEKKLNQKQLAEMLGITQSGVSYMEQNGSTVADSSIKTICSVYGLNEEWLRTGKEPMYIEPDVFSLDDFCKQHEATPQELEAIKAYFELPPDIRKYLIKHFSSRLSSGTVSDHPDTPEELESQYPPEDVTEKGAG